MNESILIVEDEIRLSAQLGQCARHRGYFVQQTSNGLDAIARVRRHPPDILLLDWSIEGISGIEVLRRLRADRATRSMPIIMMSGRGEEDDRIYGLTSGADDFLVKPLSIVELFARVRGLLNRARPDGNPVQLTVGDVVLDRAAMRVWRSGIRVELGRREFNLLAFLMARGGEVISAERLRFHLWDEANPVGLPTVAQAVCRLRISLRQPGRSDPIRTVVNEGYAIDP
jgi:two-component system phosphate regulon response regulator PhoB